MPLHPAPGAVVVRFDDAVAVRLTQDLDAAADALAAMARTLAEDAARAGRDWAGFSRRWFDQEIVSQCADLRRAATAVRRTADEGRQARAAASMLQDRRNAEALLDLAQQIRVAVFGLPA